MDKSRVNRTKQIFFILVVIILVVLQFFPVDRRNPPVQKEANFEAVYTLNSLGLNILKQACYDCHSNETNYPWYSYVAPVSFVVENHIAEGRSKLNFSEFAQYSTEKQRKKLKECTEALREGWMPLREYKWFHSRARINGAQRQLLADELENVLLQVN